METLLKVLKNEQDYNDALKLFEEFFDALDDSPEGQTREVLSILIEDYEDQHYPINMPDPVTAIKFRMEQEGLTQKDLVPLIGSKSKVSEILAGKKPLTLKMIRALNRYLDIPSEVLLQEPKEALPEAYSNWDSAKFPLRAMSRNNAFTGFNMENLNDMAEEAIRFLVDKIGGFDCLPAFNYRTGKEMRVNVKMDFYGLIGWSLQVLSEASEITVNKSFDPGFLDNSFIEGLVRLSIFDEGPRLAKEYLLKYGIILHVVYHLPKTYLDGAVFILPDNHPVIAMTLRYDRLDNFWFVLMHELGHLCLGHLGNEKRFFADDMGLRGTSDDSELEKEADDFAVKHLLPEDFSLSEESFLTSSKLIEYAQKHQVNPAIIAGRIQFDRKNYRKFAQFLGRDKVKKCFSLLER